MENFEVPSACRACQSNSHRFAKIPHQDVFAFANERYSTSCYPELGKIASYFHLTK